MRSLLPTRIAIGPRFPDPLFPKLIALGAELVLPGVGDVANDRVRLVEVNEAWVAAFLVGANHEWAREALWNEYPADLGATAFSTFWQRVPTTAADLASDLHEWPLGSTLRSHVGGSGSSTVLLVRGDVVRRFPGVELFLVTPGRGGRLVEADGSIPADRTTWPSFAGELDRATVFVGFDVDVDVVRDEGRYVAIQEPVTGPRFGFDPAGTTYRRAPATSWDELSWGHVTESAEALAALGNLRLSDTPWLDDVTRDDTTWGRNGAHQRGARSRARLLGAPVAGGGQARPPRGHPPVAREPARRPARRVGRRADRADESRGRADPAGAARTAAGSAA